MRIQITLTDGQSIHLEYVPAIMNDDFTCREVGSLSIYRVTDANEELLNNRDALAVLEQIQVMGACFEDEQLVLINEMDIRAAALPAEEAAQTQRRYFDKMVNLSAAFAYVGHAIDGYQQGFVDLKNH